VAFVGTLNDGDGDKDKIWGNGDERCMDGVKTGENAAEDGKGRGQNDFWMRGRNRSEMSPCLY